MNEMTEPASRKVNYGKRGNGINGMECSGSKWNEMYGMSEWVMCLQHSFSFASLNKLIACGAKNKFIEGMWMSSNPL